MRAQKFASSVLARNNLAYLVSRNRHRRLSFMKGDISREHGIRNAKQSILRYSRPGALTMEYLEREV